MLVPAPHLLTHRVTLSKSYEFPGTRTRRDIGGSFHPELKLHDSKDYKMPCNLINFLEAGSMRGCDLGYRLRMPRAGQEAGGPQRQHNRSLPQNRPTEPPEVAIEAESSLQHEQATRGS